MVLVTLATFKPIKDFLTSQAHHQMFECMLSSILPAFLISHSRMRAELYGNQRITWAKLTWLASIFSICWLVQRSASQIEILKSGQTLYWAMMKSKNLAFETSSQGHMGALQPTSNGESVLREQLSFGKERWCHWALARSSQPEPLWPAQGISVSATSCVDLLEVLRERQGAYLWPMPFFVVLPFWPLLRVAVSGAPGGAASVAAAFASVWDGWWLR